MDGMVDREPPKHIVPQKPLELAFLIRDLYDGRRQYFILENVATRKRQRFEGSETLLARLKELVSTILCVTPVSLARSGESDTDVGVLLVFNTYYAKVNSAHNPIK